MTNEELQAIGQLLDTKLDALEGRMNRRFDAQDQRLDTQDRRFDAMDRRMEAMHTQITRVQGLLENDVSPALDAIVEGQELITDLLKEKADRDELNALRDQVVALKTVVAAHSREIEKLKKAQ